MSASLHQPAGRGYSPALALRHLWRGPVAPRESMREALAARIGETGRLALLAVFAATLGLVDPETRALARAALENTLDDASRTEGVALLAVGIAVVACALLVAYWTAALVALALCWPRWSRASLARMRSVVALSAWFSLLPTLVVKLLAMALLPARMIAADPPSLYSAVEVVMVIPYVAACLMAAFGAGAVRATAVAALINGAFYLLVTILYLVAPAQ